MEEVTPKLVAIASRGGAQSRHRVCWSAQTQFWEGAPGPGRIIGNSQLSITLPGGRGNNEITHKPLPRFQNQVAKAPSQVSSLISERAKQRHLQVCLLLAFSLALLWEQAAVKHEGGWRVCFFNSLSPIPRGLDSCQISAHWVGGQQWLHPLPLGLVSGLKSLGLGLSGSDGVCEAESILLGVGSATFHTSLIVSKLVVQAAPF